MPRDDYLIGQSFEVLEPIKETQDLRDVSELSVMSDSVVVTVRLVLSDSVKRISIDWGDFQNDSINVLPGIATTAALPEGNNLPDGTYEFVHPYEAPEDGQPFQKNILVLLEDFDGRTEIRQAPVVVTPRYRITLYTIAVRLVSSAPRDFTVKPGYTVRFLDGDQLAGTWPWNPQIGSTQPFLLNTAGISYEVESGDPYAVRLVLDEETEDGVFIISFDLAFDIDDIASLEFTGLHAGMQIDEEQPTRQGVVGVMAERNVSLIRPLPSIGSLATYTKNEAQ